MLILVFVVRDDAADVRPGKVIETTGESAPPRPGVRKAEPPLPPALQRLSRWVAGERS